MSYNGSLSHNSNYPRMSQTEWDNAPWNDVDNPEESFDVTISQSLSKSTEVHTSDYSREYDDFEKDSIINTENVNWQEVYTKDHYTPLQLIDVLKKTAQEQLNTLENNTEMHEALKRIKRKYLKFIIKECDGWTEDETEVVED